jgi:predicted phosphodiesterase
VLIPDSTTSIFGKPVDIVVFGYTHEAMVEAHQGVLFVNPGSPSLVKQNIRLGTVAILRGYAREQDCPDS